MSRQVSDTEFNKARKEYLSYMKSVAQKYANALSPDMLSAAIDMALWRCLQNHKPEYGQKLSSSLYRFINWECCRAIRENKQRSCEVIDEVAGDNESVSIKMILDEYLSLLKPRDRRIVEARYLYNRTFTEIGVEEGCSRQAIQGIVVRSINTMAEAAQNE